MVRRAVAHAVGLFINGHDTPHQQFSGAARHRIRRCLSDLDDKHHAHPAPKDWWTRNCRSGRERHLGIGRVKHWPQRLALFHSADRPRAGAHAGAGNPRDMEPVGLDCTDAHAGRTLETTRLTPDRTGSDRAAAGK